MAPNSKPNRRYKRLNKQIEKFEMSQALQLSDDPKLQALAKMMMGIDPQTNIKMKELDRCSLATLCVKMGLSYQRAINAYRDWKRSEAVLVAAQELPAIVEGIALEAQPKELTCPTCEGNGKIIIITKDAEGKEQVKEKRCIPCEGTGQITQAGDPVARKQILEMMELAGKGAMNINAPNANVLVAAGESLEETLRAAREARQPRPDNEDEPPLRKVLPLPQ